MTEQEIVEGLATLGITGVELLKVGGAAFAIVLAAFFLGWKIGLATALIRKV